MTSRQTPTPTQAQSQSEPEPSSSSFTPQPTPLAPSSASHSLPAANPGETLFHSLTTTNTNHDSLGRSPSAASSSSSSVASPQPTPPSRTSDSPSPGPITTSSSSSRPRAPTSSDRARQPRRAVSPNEFEMDSIAPGGGGHRRRRSTHASPVGGVGPHRGQDDDKFDESDTDDDVPRRTRRHARSGDDDSGLSDEDLHDDEETGLTKKHRARKQKLKKRNAQLDQRIVRDSGGPLTAEEKQQADKFVMRNLLINGTLIGLWYIFSLSISLYNKWMFDSKELDFRFPMFTTSMHMFIQFFLSSTVLYFFPSLRPQNGHKSDLGQSRHEPDRPLMTKWFYFTRIGPCGAATGLDIGLGNTSLRFITLTFYTMCKSSSLAFVLMFAFLFRLEKPTWRLVAIIATMTAGVVMMVAGEVEFKLGGFLLVISAAFFSGFRWGLTQILLLRNPATSNPFSSIFFLAPIMFFTLFSIAVVVEGIPELIEGVKKLAETRGTIAAPAIVLFPGCIAFAMTVSEFALLQRTSVVTLSIAGIFKEVVTISAAAVVFGDRLTMVNILGLVVTIAAIAAYNYIKISRMREDARATVHGDAAPQAESDGSGSDAENDPEAEDAALLAGGSVDPGGSRSPRLTEGNVLPKRDTAVGGSSRRGD